MALTSSPSHQCLLKVHLNTFAVMRSDSFVEPQEGHHFDIKVSLISISQIPIELVHVCFRNQSSNLADPVSGLVHRDPGSSDVPPDNPAFQFDAGKVFCIT